MVLCVLAGLLFLHFYIFLAFAFLLYFAFCTHSWRRRVFIFVFFLHFCIFLHFVLIAGAGEFFYVLLHFLYFCIFWAVHTNFHAKSGLCSSTNERVMLNLVLGAGASCDQPTYRAARFTPANKY